jgi:hypothetical protein
VSNLIVRCSSIGRLMAAPTSADLDPALVDDEVRRILALKKRTDEETSVLDEVRRKSLSAGGKTHVRELVREAVYGFEPAEIATRPILKGRAVEQACIEMLARLTGRPLVKNTERRTNGLISGECDIFDAPLRHGRDVKAPYSMESMPIVLADCYDSGYEWQMQGYEILWDADTWSVDYVLVDTPEELIGLEPAALHYVSHIPEALRWTTWTVKRDRALQSLIEDKVLAARRYYRQVLNEFDRTHGVRTDKTDETPISSVSSVAPEGVPDKSRPDMDAPWDLPTAPVERPRAALAPADF